MKISELKDAPDWLETARAENKNVELYEHIVPITGGTI